MKNIEEIKNQTYALIDDLKKTTTENGLAGSGNEYVVIVEIFLYKFLNDKFIYEKKALYKSSSSSSSMPSKSPKSLSADTLPPKWSSSLNFIMLLRPHATPLLPLTS